MKPYYQTDLGTLYCGDCLEIIPDLEPVDLVLTDPPFFMPATHYQSRIGWQKTWGDTSILATFWKQIMLSFLPKLNRSGHVLVFCNHESYPVFYPLLYEKFDYLKSLVWNKGHVGLGRIWRNQHELIINARWKEAKHNNDNKLRADVLTYKATPSAKRKHPVEKPIPLLSDLILPTTMVGDVVLDPFLGSGTTSVACERLGRRWIGIEISEEYCAISKDRIEKEAQQLKLFPGSGGGMK